jgi:predicted dinucleotide-utilizing enzyme
MPALQRRTSTPLTTENTEHTEKFRTSVLSAYSVFSVVNRGLEI